MQTSTSENTAPNPVTVAGTPPLVPGTKKSTVMALGLIWAKSPGSLNVFKPASVGSDNIGSVTRPDGGACTNWRGSFCDSLTY